MIRRWILRTLALALLTLCVAAWVGSYWKIINIHCKHDRRNFTITLVPGEIAFREMNNVDLGIPGFYFLWSTATAESPRDVYNSHKYRLLGFAYQPLIVVPTFYEYRLAMVPLWFPTVLSGLVLWLIWRKTRPQSTAKGFPVEVIAKEAKNP